MGHNLKRAGSACDLRAATTPRPAGPSALLSALDAFHRFTPANKNAYSDTSWRRRCLRTLSVKGVCLVRAGALRGDVPGERCERIKLFDEDVGGGALGIAQPGFDEDKFV